MIRLSLSILFLFLISASVEAATVDPNLEFAIHQEYASTRAMAMGNAFTAVVDDHSAIFYNPAVLAFRKKGIIRGFMKFGFSNSFFTLIDDFDSASQKPESESLDAFYSVFQKNRGETFFGRGSLGGTWVRPNWGISFIPLDLKMDMSIRKQGLESLNVNTYLDTTLAYSYAKKAKGLSKKYGDFSWGVTGKAIHRIFYSDTLNPLTMAQGGSIFDQNRSAEGLSVDFDAGTYWSPKIPKKGFFSFLRAAKPSFAVVGRNLIDYGYLMNLHLLSEDSNEPTKLKRRLDLGSKWDLPNFWVFDPHLGLDLRDILHDKWTMTKGFHMGAELFWEMFSWWKGYWSLGINQGYLTYGVGARFGFFNIDLASWGDEVGSDDAPRESRKIMLEMSLEF